MPRLTKAKLERYIKTTVFEDDRLAPSAAPGKLVCQTCDTSGSEHHCPPSNNVTFVQRFETFLKKALYKYNIIIYSRHNTWPLKKESRNILLRTRADLLVQGGYMI